MIENLFGLLVGVALFVGFYIGIRFAKEQAPARATRQKAPRPAEVPSPQMALDFQDGLPVAVPVSTPPKPPGPAPIRDAKVPLSRMPMREYLHRLQQKEAGPVRAEK